MSSGGGGRYAGTAGKAQAALSCLQSSRLHFRGGKMRPDLAPSTVGAPSACKAGATRPGSPGACPAGQGTSVTLSFPATLSHLLGLPRAPGPLWNSQSCSPPVKPHSMRAPEGDGQGLPRDPLVWKPSAAVHMGQPGCLLHVHFLAPNQDGWMDPGHLNLRDAQVGQVAQATPGDPD